MSADWHSEDERYRAYVSTERKTIRIQKYIRDDGWFTVDEWVTLAEISREHLDLADKVMREFGF